MSLKIREYMITKIIHEEKIQKAKKYVEKGESFVIVTHVTPDGDAIGSALGLYHFLTAYGKDNVTVVVPNDFPQFYKWMPGHKEIVIHEKYPDFAEQLIRDADVLFCLDFNEPKRIEKLAPAVVAAEGRRVMIDHHLNPADFCRVTMSYPEMSSTSEMVFRFICRMGMFDLINKDCAACIYTGMMTDTGSFTYNSNKPEIYTIISELIKKGIDKDLDMVLLMSVNPGYGGQKFIEHSIDKTARLKDMILAKGLNTLIEVDGGVNMQTAKPLLEVGADVLVAGSFVFRSPDPLKTIRELKEL